MATLRRVPQEHLQYLLCRFIRAAGEVQGRIRMQKVTFLLGAQGRPLFTDYFYHLRGPYSRALANTLGGLVHQGLIDEERVDVAPDMVRYDYRLSDHGAQVLEGFESHPLVRGAVALGKDCEPHFLELVRRSVRELELAATVIYWTRLGYDLEEATQMTADLKGTTRDAGELKAALTIAREVLGHVGN